MTEQKLTEKVTEIKETLPELAKEIGYLPPEKVAKITGIDLLAMVCNTVCRFRMEKEGQIVCGAIKCPLEFFVGQTLKEAGYVKLANDQSLPGNPHLGIPVFYMEYQQAQEDMLKAGWRKVKLVEDYQPSP